MMLSTSFCIIFKQALFITLLITIRTNYCTLQFYALILPRLREGFMPSFGG